MFDIVKKNKWCIFFLTFVYIILVFCHFQTFIINDDLPYSLFFRAGDRITNISQILSNQFFDYSHISARVFIHIIVQFLLIFDKNLWSFVNPIIIIGIIILMSYILYNLTNRKTKPFYFVVMSTIAFLLLYNYKNLIYWVAGSVNYVWVFFLLLLFFLYYIRIGLCKHPVITFFMCLVLSMLCEVLSIFIIVLLITDIVVMICQKEFTRKKLVKYVLFLIAAILGFLFIMLAPSTMGRTGSDWSQMSFVSKILISIPVISNNMFNPINIYNLFPILAILSIVYRFKNYHVKKLNYLAILLVVLTLIGVLFTCKWVYFIIGVIILVSQIFIFIKNDDYKLIPILFASYAIVYSLAITPEYSACRTGFHTSLILGMFAIYNFTYNNDINKNYIKLLLVFAVMCLLIIEVVIYSYIGSVKRQREQSIVDVQNGKTLTLKTKIIKAPFDKFHIDANNPVDKNYWAYAAFEDYYKLPKNIKIVTK